MEEQIVSDQPQTQQIPPASRFKLKHISLFGVLLSVFLLLSIAVVVYFAGKPQELRKKATGNGVSMALTPASKTMTVNDTFSLGITISTSGTQQVSAAQISIDYDATAIEVTNVSIGSALTVPLIPAATSGKITMTLGAVPANPPTAPSGSFIVGTLTAKARKAGTTALNFTSTPNANIVTVLSYPTNALETMNGSTITILEPINTPIPTATPVPTNTPIPTSTPIITGTPNPTPTGVQHLLGDITGSENDAPDGWVDLFDYNKVLTFYINHYGETGTPGFTPEDIAGGGENGDEPDGAVDLFDLTYITRNYTPHE